MWIAESVEEIKEEVVTSENTRTVRWMRTPTARGANPSTGQVKIDVKNYL